MQNEKYKSIKLVLLLFIASCFLLSSLNGSAQETVLKVGVSIDSVPKNLYGAWRVSSKLISTNSEGTFKENNIDLWNLSRVNNVITLDNPFSKAHASITLDEVSGGFIKFKKIGDYDNKKLTDTVELTLQKETFKGVNTLKLDTISEVDGHVLKTQWATYSIKGEKISGDNIKE